MPRGAMALYNKYLINTTSFLTVSLRAYSSISIYNKYCEDRPSAEQMGRHIPLKVNAEEDFFEGIVMITSNLQRDDCIEDIISI
jgi:hypothetical protein